MIMRDDFKSLVLLGVILIAFQEAIASATTLNHNDDNRPLRSLDASICGTPEQNEEKADASDDVVRKWRQTGDARRLEVVPIIIPMFFHIINYDSTIILSTTDVQNQLDVLNEAFLPYFSFEQIDTQYTQNAEWFYEKKYDNDMKKELRQGGCNTLNVYVNSGVGYLGYARFPDDCDDNLEEDGVVLNYGTVPDGEIEGYNYGHTLTHEVGHWLGLYHTFHGGCKGKGDHVDDTPAHTVNDSCHDTMQDTCEKKAGLDPLSNFMNYTPDECMNTFTAGQFERMISHWKEYRSAVVEPTPSPTVLVPCKKGQFTFTADIHTDNYGADTKFRFQHRKNKKKGWKNVIVINNFENNANVKLRKCVSRKHCYRYKVTDQYGDGMCCEQGDGEFTVKLDEKTVTSQFLNGKKDVGRIGKKCANNNNKKNQNKGKHS